MHPEKYTRKTVIFLFHSVIVSRLLPVRCPTAPYSTVMRRRCTSRLLGPTITSKSPGSST